ncbi:MAG: hypothetical protein JSV79_10955 [Armatimonadota bacterium]|nr:MAG: hypothetical protein JSV79_10955 [Armatimonadota bacterium]
MGQRYYWPEIGRFIQQDPIASGVNWYVYARNNPLVFIDPEGETWYKPWTWFGNPPCGAAGVHLDIGGSVGHVKGVSFGLKIGYDPSAAQNPWNPYDPRTWPWVHPYGGVGTVYGGKGSVKVMSGPPGQGVWGGMSGVGGIPALLGFGPAGKFGAGTASGPDWGGGIGWGLGYFGGVEYTW